MKKITNKKMLGTPISPETAKKLRDATETYNPAMKIAKRKARIRRRPTTSTQRKKWGRR